MRLALIERFRPVIMTEISAAHLARAGDSLEDVGRFLRRYGYNFHFNLGPQHAMTEEFELAKIWSPKHPGGLYDLLAVHPKSDRRPLPARGPIVPFVRWVLQRAKKVPVWLKRRLIG